MVTDPVCGMTVNSDKAAGKFEHNNQTYYFCSQHCLSKFKEDPGKFLRSSSASETVRGHEHAHVDNSEKHDVYVCPMHPEVREPKPGACPKCGMALEPA